MSAEIPRQYNMFSGEVVDNRTRHQKRLDRQRQLPKQLAMFRQADTIQFGVSHRPWLKDLPRYQLELQSEDPRTPEEIERDLLREAEKNTESMFENHLIKGSFD